MNRFTLSFKWPVLLLMFACNTPTQKDINEPLADRSAAEIALIKREMIEVKSTLLAIQIRTTQDLDSLQQLLQNPVATANIGKEGFQKLKQAVANRLSIIEKIAAIESLDRSYEELLNTVENTRMEPVKRGQMLEQLHKTAGILKDSITNTLARIKPVQ